MKKKGKILCAGLRNVTKVFLMMSLTLYFPKISAQEALKNFDFKCLNRDQKETIELCFEEVDDCHNALKDATTPPPPITYVPDLLLSILAGFAAGVVVSKQVGF